MPSLRLLESHYHVVGRQFQYATLQIGDIVSQCEPYGRTLAGYRTERKGEGGSILADSVTVAVAEGGLCRAFREIALDKL
jgi:hypothetical protein